MTRERKRVLVFVAAIVAVAATSGWSLLADATWSIGSSSNTEWVVSSGDDGFCASVYPNSACVEQCLRTAEGRLVPTGLVCCVLEKDIPSGRESDCLERRFD